MANFVSNEDALEVLDKYAKGIKKGIGVVAVRETSPAAAAHAVGDYIRYSGTVYKVKSAISIGDSLILNTNIEANGLPDCTTIYTPGLDEENFSEEISSIVNVYGAKNLLPLTVNNIKALNTSGEWNNNVYTRNGVTYSISTDSNGNVAEININGKATSASSLILTNGATNLTSGELYALNGCPVLSNAEAYIRIIGSAADYGHGTTFTAGASYTSDIYVPVTNITITNASFKPMIRLASIKDNTYAPYAMTNRELTEKVSQLVTGTFTANLAVGDNVMNTADGSATSIVTAGTIPPYPEYCVYIVDSIGSNNNATFSIHMDGGGTHKIIHVVTNTAQSVRVRWYRVRIQQ